MQSDGLDGLIGARIKTIFDDEHGLYGTPTHRRALKEDPAYTPANYKKVAESSQAMRLRVGLYA